MDESFLTGIDVGGARADSRNTQSSLSTYTDVSSSSSSMAGSPPVSPTPMPLSFDGSSFNLASIFDPLIPTNVPSSVPLKHFMEEAEPIYGDTSDEMLKHSWRKCFVESDNVVAMSKDLFWWVMYKIKSNGATGTATIDQCLKRWSLRYLCCCRHPYGWYISWWSCCWAALGGRSWSTGFSGWVEGAYGPIESKDSSKSFFRPV